MPTAHAAHHVRLAQLEQRLRRLHVAFGLVACLLLAAALSAPDPDGPLRTTDLQLVDSNGVLLARLAPASGGAALTLFDPSGRTRLRLQHDTAETALYLYDPTDVIRVGLAQFAHGGGGLALHGPESRGAAVLYFKGRGTLTFYGDSGDRLYQIPEGPE